MSINSYAQNFEDVMLWRALHHIKNGFYIDIGAQDPIIDSVSCAFYENNWQGLHIEPTEYYAELLRQQRIGDTVIQTAVGESSKEIKFFQITGTGISTANQCIAEQHRSRGFIVEEIVVPCITLSEIFAISNQPEIHWLKVDVEGFEEQVLSGWGMSALRPWIVVIESTLPLTQIETHEKWEHFLFSRGYSHIYFDGLNRYYLSENHLELRNHFKSPPNVFDSFTLNGTASTTFHQVIQARYEKKFDELIESNKIDTDNLKEEIIFVRNELIASVITNANQRQKFIIDYEEISEKYNNKEKQAEDLIFIKKELELNISCQTLKLHAQKVSIEENERQVNELHEYYSKKEISSNFKIEGYATLVAEIQSKLDVEKEINSLLIQQISHSDQEIKAIKNTKLWRIFSMIEAISRTFNIFKKPKR